MNKLMLGAAAVALTLAVSPAFAADDSGVKLSLGGHFKGYVNYSNSDDARHTDILRDTEVHFGGETTLDNGLTVGAHIETTADGGDSFGIDESYIYMAGSWGRVNVGKEDGASYLLQVAAPSADDNIDGVRQTINPYTLTSTYGTGNLDYANDLSRAGDKVTYLSPIMNGLQVGASYTVDNTSAGSGANRTTDGNAGYTEGAVRYEGMLSNIGLIAGAGYTASTEGERNWNVGIDTDIGAFGLGAVYSKYTADDYALTGFEGTNDGYVLGADYTTGAFKLGASFATLNAEVNNVEILDANRYSAGVVYSYGPGMTFRGSVGYLDGDFAGVGEDETVATVGTQINF